MDSYQSTKEPEAEYHTLDSILKATNTRSEDYSTSDLQRLEQKIQGTYTEIPQSPIDLKYRYIMEFFETWLELPINVNALHFKYLQYLDVVHATDDEDPYKVRNSEPITADVEIAYMTLDFWHAYSSNERCGVTNEYLEMLRQVEEIFKSGVFPTTTGRYAAFHAYGKKALRMVLFLRHVKNNDSDICSRAEAEMIKTILRFLQYYEASHNRKAFHKGIAKGVYKPCKQEMVAAYGPLSPQMFQSFVLVDSCNVGNRLKRMGAPDCTMRLVSIVEQFLVRGDLHEMDFTWLSENLSPWPLEEDSKNNALFMITESDQEQLVVDHNQPQQVSETTSSAAPDETLQSKARNTDSAGGTEDTATVTSIDPLNSQSTRHSASEVLVSRRWRYKGTHEA